MGRIIAFPYAVPPEVIRYGHEANLWADADRKRLGFKMEPIYWRGLDKYTDRPGTVVSIFPIEKTDEAMLRIDWLEDQLTKYVRLTNYRELQRTHKSLINQFLRNGIRLYLANSECV